ncbi:MAG: hypothetical protein EAZ06_04835 [Cytophagales bacterium]|nr:MAG: hypothetical protein EAZ06_04835 [Cytophagales bacterium]
MKKFSFFFLLFSVFATLSAQNTYFWSGGQKQYLTSDSSTALVRVATATNINDLSKTITQNSLFSIQEMTTGGVNI